MGWTAPRTWTDTEVVTAAMMNAHVRDNLLVLKTTRSAAGRIVAISSTYFANLSAANLTGLAVPAADNDFTGRTRFLGTSRCVVPVGADKYEDLGGGLRRGVWVEGDYLHHIASDQTTEYRWLGAVVSTPAGAVPGSLWIEGVNLHYIDADGDERRCVPSASGHSDASAIAGSTWVETYQHIIREAGALEYPVHTDVAHVDGTEHSDAHTDAAHVDSHSDTGHADSHVYSHDDVAHEDAHQDVPEHADDIIFDPHTDQHWDTAHEDAHTDSHTDTAHVDSHSDTAHTDVHDDHDDHGDAAHSDQPTVVP